MYRFEYQKADDVADAVARRRSSEDGSYLAGGMTLVPTMKQRLAAPSDLIDLAGIEALKGITANGENPNDGNVWTVVGN